MNKISNGIGVSIFLLTFFFINFGDFPFASLLGASSFLAFHIIFMVILSAMLIGVIVFAICNRRKRIVEVVEFSAPKGVTPADAGYLVDCVLDDKDVSALLVYWAGKKYLKIDEKGDEFVILKKLKDADDDMKPYEKQLFNTIFANQTEVDVKELPNKIRPIAVNISSQIKTENEKKYFRTGVKTASSAFSLGSSILLAFLTFFFGMGEWFSIFCGVVLFAISTIFSNLATKLYVENKFKRLVLYIGAIIIFLIFSAINIFLSFTSLFALMLVCYATFVCLVTFIVSPLVEYRNKEGRKVLGSLLGLKKYIEIAEKDKMEKLVKENPEFYYTVLPYAYVLNVSDKWIEQFNFIKQINQKDKKDMSVALGILAVGMVLGQTTEILGGLMSHPRINSVKNNIKQK